MTKTQHWFAVLFLRWRAKPKGKRSTEEDFKAAMSFLQGVSLEQLFNCAESESFMEEENLPKPKKREHWTYLKKLNWATYT